MDSVIEKAIEARKAGKYDESRNLLFPLLNIAEYKAKASLQIAWSYDNEGKEQEAIKYYELALSGSLSAVERFDSLFGLSCTLRSLGDYPKALKCFEQTLAEFPDSAEVQPFYAMCLYNVGRHKEAVSLLLKLLVSATDNDEIKRYQQTISLYANDLDKTW
ncbi:tetratricopeptide repeat protein [Vibrio mangrovi]|uniref:Tetratrico peptide repeat protein n=1 Tax=Vibrio mangrovi TaxID=474394 RepID=A0A1Y6IP93_9VIBR|nr:tetratricopeptide repeat protein [Vibrio mangrovi]MDW6003733.1 tetratricopeptide repeat protein [Vibrio mangrovi]SMR99474.1 Tetratrico peptide repeat protein [Vibrio mangrovi]